VGAADAGVSRGVAATFKAAGELVGTVVAVGELVGSVVAVGGIEVLVGLGVDDSGVVSGDAYASLGGGVAVGGTGVAEGGTGVAVGGTDVFVAALVGVRVGTVCRKPR